MIYLDYYLHLCQLDNQQRDFEFFMLMGVIVIMFIIAYHIEYGRNSKKNKSQENTDK